MRLFVRRDAFERFVSCLVYLPRERFSTENRQRIQDILQEAFGGTSVDYTTRVTDSVLARLHVVVYTKQGAIPEYDVGEIEARLAAATRAWADDLRDALLEQLGEERAGPLVERYGDAFPGAYREDFTARQAVFDIERIERLDPDGDLGKSLYVPLAPTLDHLAFKLLRSGQPLLLSDVLPLLENMGVRVSDERPYEVRPRERPPVWIYDFGLRHDEEAEFQADDVREMFQDAFARAWRGESENDGFNRLVLSARLTAREITILRAIAKYLRQAGSTFSQNYMEDALSAHPVTSRAASSSSSGFGSTRRGSRTPTRRRERSSANWRARSTLSRASTRIGSCAASCASSELCCGRTTSRRTPAVRRSRTSRSSWIPTWCRTCPSRGRCSRSSSTRRASRPCTSAAGESRVEASAGPTAARTSAPRCSG